MDVIADLLPSNYLTKADNTSKDKKNKHQVKQKNKKQAAQQTEPNQDVQIQEQACEWDQIERRSGDDRRQQRKNRGRWLDSRTSPDRRKENIKKSLQISI